MFFGVLWVFLVLQYVAGIFPESEAMAVNEAYFP